MKKLILLIMIPMITLTGCSNTKEVHSSTLRITPPPNHAEVIKEFKDKNINPAPDNNNHMIIYNDDYLIKKYIKKAETDQTDAYYVTFTSQVERMERELEPKVVDQDTNMDRGTCSYIIEYCKVNLDEGREGLNKYYTNRVSVSYRKVDENWKMEPRRAGDGY